MKKQANVFISDLGDEIWKGKVGWIGWTVAPLLGMKVAPNIGVPILRSVTGKLNCAEVLLAHTEKLRTFFNLEDEHVGLT